MRTEDNHSTRRTSSRARYIGTTHFNPISVHAVLDEIALDELPVTLRKNETERSRLQGLISVNGHVERNEQFGKDTRRHKVQRWLINDGQ